MNILDAAIIVLLSVYAWRGLRRGFILGVVDLLGLLFILIVSFSGYLGVAPLIARAFKMRAETAQLTAFFVLVFAAGLLYTLISHSFLVALRPSRQRPRLNGANRWLGLLPGIVQGGVVASLLATALGLLPLRGSLVAQAEESMLAPRLQQASARVAPNLERLFAIGLRQPLLQVQAPGASQIKDLDFPRNLRLSVRPQAEQRMLTLINRDRRKEGLAPLAMDSKLREIARAHSREMFQKSYFAHQSPHTGSPTDRLNAAGVRYIVAGENLAYQPNVEVAHRELMNSPGHRKNLMSPLYKRVGIGVIRGGLYGEMYTQSFTD